MVRESTESGSSSAALCAMSPPGSPPRQRRRPSTGGHAGGLVYLASAAGLALLVMLGCIVREAQAAARIYDLDDALLGSDLGDLKEVRDNRVRQDAGAEDAQSDLLLVHVLFRHGDRTPDSPTYPNDPYANYSYSPIGWGGLTPAGKLTEYNIGRFLKRRYGAFLGSYKAGLLSARTTDWPRTKDSMALVLAGMFPPAAPDMWTDPVGRKPDEVLGTLWMPIASESTPRDEDKLLYMWDVPCPAYELQLQEVLQSQSFQKQFRAGANAPLISYLEKHAGAKITTPEDVYNIYQALLAQQGYNLSLPSWTSEVFPEKMKPLTALYFEVDSWNRRMQRLRAGPLLKRMLRHSVAKSRGLLRPAERKLYMYAAHDNNISAFLRALQVWETSLPPYGTAVIVEVRKKAGQVGIQLLMRNSTTTDELNALTMPGCEHFCPLHRFVQLTAEVIPDNWDAECNAV